MTKVRGPTDVVSAVPYLLGFEPEESLVVASLVGPRRRFGPLVRVDLVEPSLVPVQIDRITRLIAGRGWDRVIAVAYSAHRAVIDATMLPLTAALDSIGILAVEALGASEGRWWSYTCSNPRCCPTEGTSYDPAASQTVTAMVASGMAKAGSRDDLRTAFAPDDRMPSVAAACRLLANTLPAALDRSGDSPAMQRAVDGALGRDDLDVSAIAELLTLAQEAGHRDAAWRLMTRSNAGEHFGLWRQVMRAAPDDLLAPAATLCAFAAWLSGRGVLAAHACDRVAEVAPGYPMLDLVMLVLDRGIDPSMYAGAEAVNEARM